MGSQYKPTRSSGSGLDDRHFAVRLMDHLVVPTFVIDKDSRIVVWNKACERLTGILAKDVMGTSNHWRAFYLEPRPCLADLVAAGRYQDIGQHYTDRDNFPIGEFGVSVENWCAMPAIGRKLYLAIDAAPIYDDDGELIAVVETLRDMTAQEESQSRLRHLAAKDGLTELANRRSFDETLAIEVHRAVRDRKPLSLLMIDVDCFKLYNDTYGHRHGDQCLQTIARTITGNLRRVMDCAARYGGEEFAVILPNTECSGALQIAERIRHGVEHLGIPHETSSVADHVTLSLGAATGVGGTIEAEALIAAADEALYKSKHEGRNRTKSATIGLAFQIF